MAYEFGNHLGPLAGADGGGDERVAQVIYAELGFHCELLNMHVTVVVSEGQAVTPVPTAWPLGVAAALTLAGLAVLWSRRRGERSTREPVS